MSASCLFRVPHTQVNGQDRCVDCLFTHRMKSHKVILHITSLGCWSNRVIDEQWTINSGLFSLNTWQIMFLYFTFLQLYKNSITSLYIAQVPGILLHSLLATRQNVDTQTKYTHTHILQTHIHIDKNILLLLLLLYCIILYILLYHHEYNIIIRFQI